MGVVRYCDHNLRLSNLFLKKVKIATADIILLIFEVIASIALVVVGCFLE